VEKSSYAGIPPTKTCINCHSQIWTNAQLLEPVRQSWATGESIQWIKVHDLPDYVYFNHEIHVNKGIGCASCHGRVDEMPLMYQENTLQMEWCLNCHRNPGKNLRPTSEIYNMAWGGPTEGTPVWCASTGVNGPTAEGTTCTTTDPATRTEQPTFMQALDTHPRSMGRSESGFESDPHSTSGDVTASAQLVAFQPSAASYQKFTSQDDLGKYLTQQYHIRGANELSSCEVCHR
jgi:hypothetical protein